MERAARVELASSAWKAEAPAAIPCSLQILRRKCAAQDFACGLPLRSRPQNGSTLAGVAGFEPARTGFGDQRPSHRVLTPMAVATGVEPVPPDRQSGILPPDSATVSTGCEGTIRTCMNRVRAGHPSLLNDLATSRREHSDTVCSWKEK